MPLLQQAGWDTDYAAETVRTLCPNAQEPRAQWADPDKRNTIAPLAKRGISFEELIDQAKQPKANSFDLLCRSGSSRSGRISSSALVGQNELIA